MATIGKRLKHAWNVFRNEESQTNRIQSFGEFGSGYSYRPDRFRSTIVNDRSLVASIHTRISIDVAASSIRHVKKDDNGQYLETIDSGLNNCLTLEANIDQSARDFRQDVVMTLCDKGVAAIVPVDTTINPLHTGGFDIKTMRVGEVVSWYPRHVKLSVYNDLVGEREEVTLPKDKVAIVENPLYSVMNEPNSTLQRLIRKLSFLDAIDEQTSSGKLDLIIQLPYVIKSEARRQQAEQRRKDIEVQLKGSKYGIAYTDGTERITQLNRPAENNLLKQVEYLTTMLYGQLGVTEDVFNGTADEKTMLNYHNRTIEPILSAITDSINRKFLSKTARTQNQAVMAFREPFKHVAVGDIAEIADKFTRNEILTSNEIRGIIGFRPSRDPKADELRNSNLSAPKEEVPNKVSELEEDTNERSTSK